MSTIDYAAVWKIICTSPNAIVALKAFVEQEIENAKASPTPVKVRLFKMAGHAAGCVCAGCTLSPDRRNRCPACGSDACCTHFCRCTGNSEKCRVIR